MAEGGEQRRGLESGQGGTSGEATTGTSVKREGHERDNNPPAWLSKSQGQTSEAGETQNSRADDPAGRCGYRPPPTEQTAVCWRAQSRRVHRKRCVGTPSAPGHLWNTVDPPSTISACQFSPFAGTMGGPVSHHRQCARRSAKRTALVLGNGNRCAIVIPGRSPNSVMFALSWRPEVRASDAYGRSVKSWRGPSQADRCLGQSNAEKRLFDRHGLSTFWRNRNTTCASFRLGGWTTTTRAATPTRPHARLGPRSTWCSRSRPATSAASTMSVATALATISFRGDSRACCPPVGEGVPCRAGMAACGSTRCRMAHSCAAIIVPRHPSKT